MRRLVPLFAVVTAASLGACSGASTRTSHAGGEAQMVSLVVRSEPPGALVRVNRLIKTWLTPCDIADFSITRGMVDLEVSLEGYDPVMPRVYYDGEHPVRIDAKLVSRRPPAPAPEAAPQPKAAAAAPADPAAGTQIRVEPVRGGSRVTVLAPGARVRITAGTIMTDVDRPGVYFVADAPSENAKIEMVDPVTGTVLETLSLSQGAPPRPAAVAPAPAPAAPAAPAPIAAPAPVYYAPAPQVAPPTTYYAPSTPYYYLVPNGAPQYSVPYYYMPVTTPR